MPQSNETKKIYRAHKVRLVPNNVQVSQFRRACGTARFAYNWALREWQDQYRASLEDPEVARPSEAALRKRLNSIKRESFPWMYEVTKCAPQQAIKDLGRAFESFFRGKTRYPAPRRRGKSRDSFYLDNLSVAHEGKRIRIARVGWVAAREAPRWPDGKVLSCVVSREGTRWFASLQYEVEVPDRRHTGPAAGVDLGMADLAITSDGVKYENPRSTRRHAARIRRLNKQLARRTRGGSNWSKTRDRLNRAHARIRAQRTDHLHKVSRDLVDRYGLIGLEDLHVKGMVRNRSLASALHDAALGELSRQIEYKAEETGARIHRVSRWYPSSKTCSSCGVETQDLTLSTRVWRCTACGAVHDRDVNAAINLRNEALAASSAVTACGDEGSGPDALRASVVKPLSMKQEPNLVGNHV